MFLLDKVIGRESNNMEKEHLFFRAQDFDVYYGYYNCSER